MNLATIDKCTGCSACANACSHDAITMEPDSEGFLRPMIDEKKCIECHLCEKSCPIVSPNTNINTDNPRAYAMWSLLDRTISSSGGAFSAFARMILNNGGIVFGAAFDEQFVCHHIRVEHLDGLKSLRGSKYVQSSIGTIFREVKKDLNKGKYVLFCGTPCQIAGLKSFLRKDNEKLLLLDLACHGVPSNGIFQAYLQKISTRFVGTLEGFEFRRRDGWGKAPSISLGGKFSPIYGTDALYMSAFDRNAIFRKSCYSCPFACLPRLGDCSLADFWGIGRHGKKFEHSVTKGVSLVLSNNEKGQSFIDKLTDVFIEERNLNEALVENHNISHSSILYPMRNEVVKAFLNKNLSLDDIEKQYHLIDKSLKSKVKEYASKYHVFDMVKYIYNIWKAK